MVIDIDTRKMKFKKDDILIFGDNKFTTISKKDLLKPLYDEIKKDKKRITDLEITNKQLKDDVRELKILEAGL